MRKKQGKGFGAPSSPRLWLQVIYHDDGKPLKNIHFNGSDANAQEKCRLLLQDLRVAIVLVLEGTADPNKPLARQTLAEHRRDWVPGQKLAEPKNAEGKVGGFQKLLGGFSKE